MDGINWVQQPNGLQLRGQKVTILFKTVAEPC